MKKEAELYDKLEDNKVQCKVCALKCIIKDGNRGHCNTRKNEGGILYTLVYGSLISQGSIDPIEKKPLYNFWPGHNIYSIATIGCNFRCKMCQNWTISQCFPNENGTKAKFKDEEVLARNFSLTELQPAQLIKLVKRAESKLIAFTYNEPTIWYEYILDVSKIAKENNIKTVLVTNGYASFESAEVLVKYIDAANIDFKAFSDDFYKRVAKVPSMKPVLDTAKYWKSKGMHIEITNLIIPDENDDPKEIRAMCKWIYDNLGKDTPLHFSAYHPDYKMNEHPRTPAKILEEAYEIAEDEGLNYIYIGNLQTSKGNDTLCPNCKKPVIRRYGYAIREINLTEENRCNFCKSKVDIIGKSKKRSSFFF